MVPTSARLAAVVSRSGRIASARSRNSSAAGLARTASASCSPSAGTGSGSIHRTCSRGTRRVSRLRHDDLEARRPRLEVGERRGGGRHVLGGVEDEEGGRRAQLVGQRLGQRLVERAARLVGDPDRCLRSPAARATRR